MTIKTWTLPSWKRTRMTMMMSSATWALQVWLQSVQGCCCHMLRAAGMLACQQRCTICLLIIKAVLPAFQLL